MDFLNSLLQAQLHTHLDTRLTNGEKAIASVLLLSVLTGFIFLTSKLFNFVRMLFSLFILPGKSVSDFPFLY